MSLVLGALALGTYWPVTRHGFINYDDPDYVTENPIVLGGLQWNAIVSVFCHPYASNWHPLTWLSHMLDCELFGMNPGGHHFTNLLLHTANTLLLFFLLRGLTGALWRSGFVAAFFALHPLHVESVAWVAERKDVLSTFFFLLTLIAYGRHASRIEGRGLSGGQSKVQSPSAPKRREQLPIAHSQFPASRRFFYFLALLFFALGLMSKPMVVTLPFVLLLLDFWPLRRGFRGPAFEEGPGIVAPAPPPAPTGRPPGARPLGLMVEKIPFFALAAASCVVTLWAQRAGHAMASLESFPLGLRLANAPAACLAYLGKTFWPAHLAVFYPHLGMPALEKLLAAMVLLLGISMLALGQLRARPFLAVGWFWFLGTLVPVLGLVQVGVQAYADRYMYIPSIGLFLLLVWGLASVIPTILARRAAILLGAAALIGCAAVTILQLRHWTSAKALFTHAREATTHNYLACTFVAEALADEGRYDEAVKLLDEAVSYTTNYSDAYLSYGRILERTGNFEGAGRFYARALQLNPVSDLARFGLASALSKSKNFAGSIEHYEAVLKINPNLWQARLGLALALMAMERPSEAVIQMQPVVQAQPGNAETRFILALALHAAGNTNEARQGFQAALALDPALPDKDCAEGKGLASSGQIEGALSKFRAALLLKPDHAEAHEQYGLLLAQQGQMRAAIEHFEEVLRLRPNAQAYYNLALARIVQGRAREAIANYRQALQLEPDRADALNDLAWVLATHSSAELRNGSEAVRLAERLCRVSGGKEARHWGTLDAAYAETGQFAQAIRTAEKARQVALASGQADIAEAAGQRLALYRRNQAYRQPERADSPEPGASGR